jgi:hypothetical protein
MSDARPTIPNDEGLSREFADRSSFSKKIPLATRTIRCDDGVLLTVFHGFSGNTYFNSFFLRPDGFSPRHSEISSGALASVKCAGLSL